MQKGYLTKRINELVGEINYEEKEYGEAKTMGGVNCYGVSYSLGRLDALRRELLSHQNYLNEDFPKKRKASPRNV